MHQRHLLVTLAFVIAAVASAQTGPPVAPDSPASVPFGEAAEPVAAEATMDFIEQAENDTLSEEELEQSSAYEKANSDYRRALSRDLRESANPRDLALAAQVWTDEDDSDATAGARAALLNNAALAAPDDIVVQWLWAHSTLEAAGTCGAGGLDPRRVARLISTEPDNAAVWLRQLDLAYAAGDDAAIDDALTRMAASGRHDEHVIEIVDAWRRVYLAYPPPPKPLVAARDSVVASPARAAETLAFELALWQAISTVPPMQSLMRVCNAATGESRRWQRYAICGDAARRMTHSPIVISRLIGHLVLQRSGQQTPQDLAEWREDRWIADRFRNLPEDPESILAFMHEWRVSGDEFDAMRSRVRQAGLPLVPPPTWQPPEFAAQRTAAPAEATAD